MEYKKTSFGGYNLHLIKTDKFKNCHIEVVFRNTLNSEEITKRQFLTRILCESNSKYPTNQGGLDLKCQFLMEGTKFSNNSLEINGTWLDKPREPDSSITYRVYAYYRYLNYHYANVTSYGVRPTIEILKSEISY